MKIMLAKRDFRPTPKYLENLMDRVLLPQYASLDGLQNYVREKLLEEDYLSKKRR